jgi:hypothetical protein
MGDVREAPVRADRDAPRNAPDTRTGCAAAATAGAGILALQRTVGNKAATRLITSASTTASSRGRTLARVPTVAEQVIAASDKNAWRRVAALLAARRMSALLDILTAVEEKQKLTWIAINVDAELPKTARERVLAAIAAVQHAPAEEQMRHRLMLGKEDEKELAAWLTAHPDPLPLPTPEPEPIRRSDGTVFDPPAGAASDRDWARALLRFFHLRSASTPVGNDACTLDGHSSTLSDVALFVSETALFAGGHLIDPTQARGYVDECFGEIRAALDAAHDVEAKLSAKDVGALLKMMSDVPMTRLLAVLDTLRVDGKLDELKDTLASAPPPNRLQAALLAAGGHLGVRFTNACKGLPETDLAPLRAFLFEMLIYRDIPPRVRLVHLNNDPLQGQEFHYPPEADDDSWVDGFVHFFRPAQVPFDDDKLWFNEAQRSIDEIVDITVEQGALDGRQLDPVRVRDLIGTFRSSMPKRAPLEPKQIVLQYTFVPYTSHKPLGPGDPGYDKPGHQVAVQYTVKFKNVGAWWSEVDLSALAQITLFADPRTGNVDPNWYDLNLQSLVAGGQAAWVIPLFTDKVQLQAVVQGVLGQARDVRAGADGKLVVRDVLGHGPAMGQIAAQLQIVIQPWDNVPVQFFIGTQGSLTQVSKTTTLDGTPVLGGIQIPLSLP